MATNRQKLRGQGWFAQPTYESLTHRAAIRAEGFTADVFQNRPVIGICNSWSELNHCNLHLRTVAEAVKRGVWAAGGFPPEFPTISLGEIYMKPTTMLYRNLMAIDVEESIRANPLEGWTHPGLGAGSSRRHGVRQRRRRGRPKGQVDSPAGIG